MSAGRFALTPEEVIVALARGGDEHAFVELVTRREASLRRMLQRLCGDASLAEDLAQQALVRAWKRLGGLREPAAFGGWLKRIAVHTWLQHARRRGLDLTAIEAAGELADTALPSPDDGIDLARALASLRPAERTCVVLSHGEGMTHEEIAAATGLPLGSVKSHIGRGCARLRTMLQPQGSQ